MRMSLSKKEQEVRGECELAITENTGCPWSDYHVR